MALPIFLPRRQRRILGGSGPEGRCGGRKFIGSRFRIHLDTASGLLEFGGLQPSGSRRGVGEVAGDATANTAGGMVTAGLGDAGETGLGGLQAGHRAHVVEAVEDFVVEHQLGLVLRMGEVVPHVGALSS